MNGLRSRIAVQVDGGLRTGRDVIIGALLGADEFGFATAPLIAAGCIMMRKCHLNTCPVGVATQDPVLRKRFVGLPEHVINFFFFVAEEVRELMAALGYRNFDEMVGQRQMLDKTKLVEHWKAQGPRFHRSLPTSPSPGLATRSIAARRRITASTMFSTGKFIAEAAEAIEHAKHVRLEMPIRNSDRSAGAMLSGEIARRYGHAGLRNEAIHIKLKGSAGQSFGAFLANGVTLELEGEANDYVAKGLSGGRVVVYPPKEATKLVPERSIIVGNTALYGAIAGECYFRGVGGERFGVRNSGAIAVVEGTGDHGCEYMTGGIVVVIGETGRNFAAGMSGGIAYVLDEAGDFAQALQSVDGRTRTGRGGGGADAAPPSFGRRSRRPWPRRHHGRHEPARFRTPASIDRQSRALYRLDPGARDPGELGRLSAEVPQGDAGRISARAGGACGAEGSEVLLAGE